MHDLIDSFQRLQLRQAPYQNSSVPIGWSPPFKLRMVDGRRRKVSIVYGTLLIPSAMAHPFCQRSSDRLLWSPLSPLALPGCPAAARSSFSRGMLRLCGGHAGRTLVPHVAAAWFCHHLLWHTRTLGLSRNHQPFIYPHRGEPCDLGPVLT